MNLFVGRDVELTRLRATVQGSIEDGPRFVIIEGEPGAGKSLLLKELQTSLATTPNRKSTVFVSGYCYPVASGQSSFQPFSEVLAKLGTDDRYHHIRSFVRQVLKQTAPDWLSIVPLVGSAVVATLRTGLAARDWFLQSHDSRHQDLEQKLPSQFARALEKITTKGPLVIAIEDAHWIDEASALLALKLAHGIRDCPLTLIITVRSTEVANKSPGGQLVRELLRHRRCLHLPVGGFDRPAVETYLKSRYGDLLSRHFSEWLMTLCNGNPFFLAQYLCLLEDEGIIQRDRAQFVLHGGFVRGPGGLRATGKLTSLPIPKSIDAVLEQRLDGLLDEQKRLLEVGAVQGQSFVALVLERSLAVPEADLLGRLREVVEKHQLLQYASGHEWAEGKTQAYRFDHALLQQALYRRLSPRERFKHHQEAAEALSSLYQEPGRKQSGLASLIAFHWSGAGKAEAAAEYYLQAARLSFAQGAFGTAIRCCLDGIEQSRAIGQPSSSVTRTAAELIHLALSCSILRLRGATVLERQTSVLALVEEGEAAAAKIGDAALRSQIRYLKGRVLLTSQGLEEALAALREALELAREAGDRLCELVALSELGHQLVKKDMAAGLDLLDSARKLLEQHAEEFEQDQTQVTELQRFVLKLDVQAGVGLFDSGDFGKGRHLLLRGIEGLERLGMKDDLLAAYNFLAQLQMMSGDLESAKGSLRKADTLVARDDGPNPWHAYNQALLGRIYLENGELDEAAELIQTGWKETEMAWNADLGVIVRNYHAELLMDAAFPNRNVAAAREDLKENAEYSRRVGMHRSAIAALSLLGELERSEGRREAALTASAEAVSYLDKMGTMPALRSEEVYFRHGRLLQESDRRSEGEELLRRAHEIVRQKAETLETSAMQQRFWSAVQLNQAILAAWSQISALPDEISPGRVADGAQPTVELPLSALAGGEGPQLA